MRYYLVLGSVGVIGLMLVVIYMVPVQDSNIDVKPPVPLEIRYCIDANKAPTCISDIDGWLECLDRFTFCSKTENGSDFEHVDLDIFDESESTLEFKLSNSSRMYTNSARLRRVGFTRCRLQLKQLVEVYGYDKVRSSLMVFLPGGEESAFELRNHDELLRFVDFYRQQEQLVEQQELMDAKNKARGAGPKKSDD